MSAPDAAPPVVLIPLNCLWPGNDASGPNQSLLALATALKGEFDFVIVSRDRPPGAPASTDPTGGAWTQWGGARLRHVPVGPFGAKGLIGLLRAIPHDLIWLNSAFDPEFVLPTLAAARLGLLPRRPILLSPRGEFGAGALNVKSLKKQLFLKVARATRLYAGVTLHATSQAEAADIGAGGTGGAAIVVAPNMRLMLEPPPFVPPGDALRVIFVGRVAPIKNLDFALQALAQARAKVEFEIFGPLEDELCVKRCQALAARLPANVSVRWRGEASNREIVIAHARSDLFLLPTGGENFGHAIFEALSCGVPALISDRTPWRRLSAARAGWDLPLDDPAPFAQTIERYAALSAEERASWRAGAREAARRWVETSGGGAANTRMLRDLIGAAAPR